MARTQHIRLTKEERQWESWITSGKAKRIANFEEVKKALTASARAKTKLVSIRVRENDLLRLRERASEEGLPYQTLINSLIHKYVQKQ